MSSMLPTDYSWKREEHWGDSSATVGNFVNGVEESPLFSFDVNSSFGENGESLSNGSIAPKRKTEDDEIMEESKRLKLKLGVSNVNVIEHETSSPEHDDDDGCSEGGSGGDPSTKDSALLLGDDEVLALSDAFSEGASDSFGDEESADESGEDNQGHLLVDFNDGEEEGEFKDDERARPGRPGGKTLQGHGGKAHHRKVGKGKQHGNNNGGGDARKARGNYACSKCGLPKRGHVCVVQPRIRRRNPQASEAPSSSASGGGASANSNKPVTARQAQKMRTAAAKQEAALAKAAAATSTTSGGPGTGTVLYAKTAPFKSVVLVDSAAGSSSQYVPPPPASRNRAGSGNPAQEEEKERPVMCDAQSQCELDGPGNTVRELYLDAQGFPESYTQGILADPTFRLDTARTITVSRPPPKSYTPRAPTTASCGAGPDGGSGFLLQHHHSQTTAASALLQAAAAAAASGGHAGAGLLAPNLFGAHPLGVHHAPTSSSPSAVTAQLLQAAAAAAAAAGSGSNPLQALFPPATAPQAPLNHSLALLMSSYQQQQKQQQAKQQQAVAAALSGPTVGLDSSSALASLLFPVQAAAAAAVQATNPPPSTSAPVKSHHHVSRAVSSEAP